MLLSLCIGFSMNITSEIKNMNNKNQEESTPQNQEESSGSSIVIHTFTPQTIIPQRSICTVGVAKNALVGQQHK
jgi:hypothetical protein